jgi:addiction module RelE/StbE family toxin
MAYRIELSQRVAKSIRKLDRPLQKVLIQKLQQIQINPRSAYQLTGEFKGLWSFHFTHKGTAYRIIYRIIEKDVLVLIVLVSSRESAYDKLRRIT